MKSKHLPCLSYLHYDSFHLNMGQETEKRVQPWIQKVILCWVIVIILSVIGVYIGFLVQNYSIGVEGVRHIPALMT